MSTGGRAFVVSAIAVGVVMLGPARPGAQQAGGPPPSVTLRPTAHPPLPSDPSQFWMVPTTKAQTTRTAALDTLVAAINLQGAGDAAKALPVLSRPLQPDHPLHAYARYHKGLAELSLGRASEAQRTFRALTDDAPVGFLSEAGALREAEAYEALGDHAAALTLYERLAIAKTDAPDYVLMRAGLAAEALGDKAKALRAYSRVYYEFPFGDMASAANLALERLGNRPPLEEQLPRYSLELGRAERLFQGRRYTDARAAFVRLRSVADDDDDEELVDLRIAESDYYLKRLQAARDGVKPYTQRARRQGEALFFYAIALYDLGDRSEYFRIVRRLADDFAAQTWAEEALNHLATHYIRDDENDKADLTFREMLDRFGAGRYAERAAWKVGWSSYRKGQYGDTIAVFERAAATFPRSDYRPAWLYWSARAYEARAQMPQAAARFRLTATDYFNSYYGRLALDRIKDGIGVRRAMVAEARERHLARETANLDDEGDVGSLTPPNEDVIRALLGVGLYAQAIDELEYAQRIWGDSPAILATLGWAYQRQGLAEKGGAPQFTLYRNAINTMKRAYPHYLAVSGEHLPADVLRVIFPLDYWDLIRKHASANKLDPYLVAALVAQESTFVRDIRSPARAVGLMQLMPATARRVARSLKMRYSASLLTNPEASIRIGTALLAQNLREFGEMHYVLASYNAGERAVRRWIAERPGLPRDEFIDDIPYPETQSYVKRILGTAEDYRRLYK